MQGNRVRVRRDHPSALSWTIALVMTMLAVYLATLGGGGQKGSSASIETDADTPRVTEEISLEGVEAYCVSFGNFSTSQEARIEAARFTSRGAAGYVREEDGFYILGAVYEQESDAKRVAEQISQSEGIECSVYPLQAGGARLRVTAGESQLALLREAETQLRSQARIVGELAFQLDRGEISSDQARTILAVCASQVSQPLEALREIPGAQENAICGGLLEILESFHASCSLLSMENSASALSLSGKIKYNYIEVLFSCADYLTQLNAM